MSIEDDLIAWLRANLPSSPRLDIGLGDDAAVLNGFCEPNAVVTTDMLTEGVDFILQEIDPRQAGHKALAVNLSDLAAMAAKPVAAFVSLVLPQRGTDKLSALELAIALYQGMLPLAEQLGIVIAGGDTNTWAGPLAISITAIGETSSRGPLKRSGAQKGDRLLVTGRLGGSILGRHLSVEPRVDEALLLHKQYSLHAGIDISDGLALDTLRLAEASGVGAVLDLQTIPLSEDAHRLSERDGRSAIEHGLGDGEDFELLLTVPDEAAQELLQEQPLSVPITCIGEIVREVGLWQVDGSGNRVPLVPLGFQHQSAE